MRWGGGGDGGSGGGGGGGGGEILKHPPPDRTSCLPGAREHGPQSHTILNNRIRTAAAPSMKIVLQKVQQNFDDFL